MVYRSLAKAMVSQTNGQRDAYDMLTANRTDTQRL